jgi:hypothetical protein
MITVLVTAVFVSGLLTLYFAWRSREFRKFVAGAFFVSAGMQFYLYLTGVSVPLLGTDLTQMPEISGSRSIPAFSSFCCVSTSALSGNRDGHPDESHPTQF